jgi:hypothetical protein
VSEKLEQTAKVMAKYEEQEQEQENPIKNNKDTKPRAICGCCYYCRYRGMGGDLMAEEE